LISADIQRTVGPAQACGRRISHGLDIA